VSHFYLINKLLPTKYTPSVFLYVIIAVNNLYGFKPINGTLSLSKGDENLQEV